MSKLPLMKQKLKMYLQNVYLPKVYQKAVKKTEVDKKKVILADMHSDTIPFSMQAMYNTLVRKGYNPIVYCRDIGKLPAGAKLRFMTDFMKEYAAAGYVYICSYFLPVSSCEKRPETKVIQLWHSGGLLKKMGYDTYDDIPKNYKGNVTANYDLVTVSADVCVPVWESALKLPKGITEATGISRTDNYFSDDWNASKRDAFYKAYPEAKGKKVVLYAPSFSGNAADPRCAGIEAGIELVMKDYGEDYFFIVRLHPHLRDKYPQYWTKRDREFPTETLLPVTSILITDYSSVLFDYSIYKKPFVLFCPDIEMFEKKRGFYVDINTFPAPIAKSARELDEILKERKYFDYDEEAYEEFCKTYMGACDGKVSERIIEVVETLEQ